MIFVTMQYTAIPRSSEDFQQPPTLAELRALCRRMLGDVVVVSAEEIGGGMFNNAFAIATADGGKYVVRISPPHDHPLLFSNERYLMRREYGIGPFLAAAAPLLPKVVAADFTCQVFNRDAVMSEFIEGENWDSVKDQLTPGQNDAIWRQLGTILCRIHSTPGTSFGWCGPERSFARWSEFILHAAHGLLADYARFGLEATEAAEWVRVVEEGAWVLDQVAQPRLVHGDPWPKNVLIQREDESARIVGLLDHERGLWGDPMDEWVFHQLGFPPAFWDAYGARPTGAAAEFRDCVYFGLIDEQLVLEGYRYRFDVKWVRGRLVETTAKMREILQRCR